ncbi:MAG: hypothetical protein RLZZ350_978 [Verrucomicrobiota bacterium]|jgi:MscS family membrane protein
MKWRFQWLYWFGLAVLFVTAGWAVFADAQTVSNVVANAGSHAPSGGSNTNAPLLTFGLDQIPLLADTKPFGEPLWKYFSSLIYVVLAFGAAWCADYFIGVVLKRWAAKTETKYDDLILDLLRGPVKVIAFVVFLNFGLTVYDWPDAAEKIISRGLVLVVACAITYVVLKLVDLLIGLWRERIATTGEDKEFAEQLLPLVRKVAKVGVIIAGVLITAENLHIEIKSLLAGLSVGGLALGLAAQDTVANLFGAVAIFLDKPFRIGDRIKVETVDGNVETIGLRSTRIRNLDGHLVAVPNKTMGNAIITNISRRPLIRTEMNFGLVADTPTAKVRRATEILGEIFRAHPRTSDLIISFNKFTDSALNIFVVHVWDGAEAKEHFAALQELNLQIKQRFEAEQIEFAFPTQTIHLKTAAAK